MPKFITPIKTNYTKSENKENEKVFESKYSARRTRKCISGSARNENQQYASRFVER